MGDKHIMLSFLAEDEFARQIRIAAAKQNQSRSAFIRDALKHYIAHLDKQRAK